MLRPEDERAIEDLFERLRNVEGRSGPRDADAERLIRQRLSEHPAAAYFMAQTIIVQEAALREAQARIEVLEAEARGGDRGFLGGIFGGERPSLARDQRRGPWGVPDQSEDFSRRRPEGGGFLAGAAQTALGVTGGILLGTAIAGMFTGGAQADEAPAEDPPAEDPGMDDGGDWGDFDVGGDF